MASLQGGHTRAIYGLIREGKLLEAIDMLHGVMQVAPDSRAAMSLLAHCYYQQEDYESAARMYELLAQRFSHVPEYQLHWAQSLCKSGLFVEAARAAASVQGFGQEVVQLQACIKYESGDLRGCRLALEGAVCAGDPAATAAAACILYKQGQYGAAAEQFTQAAQLAGYTPELAYAIAVCQYQQRDYPGALASLAEIVDAGVQQHPELGIGTQAEGMEARSVGNSAKLKLTALVEAFNLRAAVELSLGNPAGAAAALSDMPPRQERELDPVTLHNRALVGLALNPSPISRDAELDKLAHLLANPPFPPELIGNLLSLCCRPGEAALTPATGSFDHGAMAEQLLSEHAAAVAATVPQELVSLYQACLACKGSEVDAAARLDAAAGLHVEGLRRRVKALQDARLAGDQEAAAAELEVYEQALEAYMPVLMSLAQLHWADGNCVKAQEALQQSAEFCSDHPAWRLALAHTLVAQEGGRHGEAAELYDSLVQHFTGIAGDASTVEEGGDGAGSLLDVPPTALANLCVCYVLAGRNEAAEELLRRLEDESVAAQAAGQGPTRHLPSTNLGIGTLYCSKGNFEFGITRVLRSLQPLSRGLDPEHWRGVMLCLLCLLDQVAKNMMVLKDALVADLLSFLEDVEEAGAGQPVLPAGRRSGAAVQLTTVAAQARGLRAVLLRISE